MGYIIPRSNTRGLKCQVVECNWSLLNLQYAKRFVGVFFLLDIQVVTCRILLNLLSICSLNCSTLLSNSLSILFLSLVKLSIVISVIRACLFYATQKDCAVFFASFWGNEVLHLIESVQSEL